MCSIDLVFVQNLLDADENLRNFSFYASYIWNGIAVRLPLSTLSRSSDAGMSATYEATIRYNKRYLLSLVEYSSLSTAGSASGFIAQFMHVYKDFIFNNLLLSLEILFSMLRIADWRIYI